MTVAERCAACLERFLIHRCRPTQLPWASSSDAMSMINTRSRTSVVVVALLCLPCSGRVAETLWTALAASCCKWKVRRPITTRRGMRTLAVRMARLLQSQGKLGEADPLFREALEADTRRPPHLHPDLEQHDLKITCSAQADRL